MEKLGYTDTEALLWDYSETEQYYVLAIPPARARRTLYRVTAEYAFQWFGLQSNLTIVYYPFSQINFRNLTDPCVCSPEVDAFTATVSVNPSSVDEDGGIPLVFTIYLDHISAADATLDFTLTGTAIEGVDYIAVPHTVTITAGTLSATVTINLIEDVFIEDIESVILTLTSGVSGPGLIDVSGGTKTGHIAATPVVVRGIPIDAGGVAPSYRTVFHQSLFQPPFKPQLVPLSKRLAIPLAMGGAAPRLRQVYYQARFDVPNIPYVPPPAVSLKKAIPLDMGGAAPRRQQVYYRSTSGWPLKP